MTELWERQAWDTNTSYTRFRHYYLPQDPPRSLDEAYREYKRQTLDKPIAKTVRASLHWRWWSQGKDYKGEPIPGAVSWDARAQAWDDHELEISLRRHEQEREQRRKQLRLLADTAWDKVSRAWINFDPQKDDVKLSELVAALRTVAQEVRSAYDLEQPTRINIEIDVWRQEIIDLIQSGSVNFREVKQELGDDLASELFVAAGMATGAAFEAETESGEGERA